MLCYVAITNTVVFFTVWEAKAAGQVYDNLFTRVWCFFLWLQLTAQNRRHEPRAQLCILDKKPQLDTSDRGVEF